MNAQFDRWSNNRESPGKTAFFPTDVLAIGKASFSAFTSHVSPCTVIHSGSLCPEDEISCHICRILTALMTS
jgi:hypothetical protein